MRCSHSEKGLSLVELMVSTAIVGLLGSVAVPSYNKYVAEARMSEGVRYMGILRGEQTAAYARSMGLDSGPHYADRFISLQPTRSALPFRVSGNARFDVIVGTANASVGGWIQGEAVAQSDLPDTVFSNEFVVGQAANRAAGFGAYSLGNGTHDFAMAVVGDIDGDPEFTMFVSTRTRPLIMACNDLDGTGSITGDWELVAGSTAGGTTVLNLEVVTPNCAPTEQSGDDGGGAGM